MSESYDDMVTLDVTPFLTNSVNARKNNYNGSMTEGLTSSVTGCVNGILMLPGYIFHSITDYTRPIWGMCYSSDDGNSNNNYSSGYTNTSVFR